MTSAAATNVLAEFERAFEALGLTPDASQKDVKRAYRRAVAQHPPDRDAEGFQRVRAAYERLCQPDGTLEWLTQPETHVPLPALAAPPEVELRRTLPLAAMRAAVAKIDASDLLGGQDG